MMNWTAKWIRSSIDMGEVCPVFIRDFACEKKVKSAILSITALGVYEAQINQQRVGEFVFAPGWTAYDKRLQVQQYDVTRLLKDQNEIQVTVGTGWYSGRVGTWRFAEEKKAEREQMGSGFTAELMLYFEDGTTCSICSDEEWYVMESQIRFSDIYDGEIFDASFETTEKWPVKIFEGPTHTLIPQQGEEIREQEVVTPVGIFTTPKGEVVIDFGQEITGYVETTLTAVDGEKVSLSFAEVLDPYGNFYTENYRSAKCQYQYTCKAGLQSYKPKLAFYGFRYVRIDEFPGGTEKAKQENFRAIEIHSQMERTGYLSCSDPLLNKLFENIIWGQKDNFLDVPTDCPQRDERMGWTGDAQVFIRAACLNYDVERFFTKWLADMAADQKEDGRIPHIVPECYTERPGGAAWGDAAVICPWQLYLAYGNREILEMQYDCMTGWIKWITDHTEKEYLWIQEFQFGDWLGLDAPSGSYKGSTREDFLASAFYAYSTGLVAKIGKILGKNVEYYETLYSNIVKTFREEYPVYTTQTEHVLAIYFNLAPDCQAAADQLAEMIRSCGTKLQTGFVGTPYLLHVLSDYGHTKLAYDLLLRREYPSWLYPVTKGATTIWEHWDGIMENGDFWDPEMNSFNHYAYGAVADWVYCKAAGIQAMEEYPGYEKVKIAPLTDDRLGWLEAKLKTRRGQICSKWQKQDGVWRYDIETPVEAIIALGDKEYRVGPGKYVYFTSVTE